MKFGPVATAEAVGTLLAHSLSEGPVRLRKGRLLTADDILQLQEAGVPEVVVARLETDDVGEDEAAGFLAEALSIDRIRVGPAATGRVNFFAKENGLLRVDAAAIDRFNQIDPAITIATLSDYSAVSDGDMVATIKIIPLAVARDRLDEAAAVARTRGILAVRGYTPAQVGVVATTLPSLKTAVMDKTTRLLQRRLDMSGSRISAERRVPHRAGNVATAIVDLTEESDLIVVFGASAIVDPADVIPESIRLAGGMVDQVGMPVDPGNLLVLGQVNDVPVIGAPGCARSPKENGFDWVLARILAGDVPSSEAIMKMGVGGLLMEIPSRPQPRNKPPKSKPDTLPIDILVLAAGRASRMLNPDAVGAGTSPHKLLAEFDGEPLIRRSVSTALQAGGRDTHVIVGYRADEMRSALEGLDVDIIDNHDFDDGMASSLQRGVAALSAGAAGVLILLADMPAIGSDDLRKMLHAFAEAGGGCVVRAVSGGVRGNPVILPRETFDAVAALEGDVGARHIVAASGLPIIDVDIGDAALLDVDTQEAVLAAGGVLKN